MVVKKCEHGKRKYQCKECGGGGICQHNKVRQDCIECKGSNICEHEKRRRFCKECSGSQICQHNKRKYRCKECQGIGICEHNKEKSNCKECGGSGICEHNKRKPYCKECRGSQICEHNNDKTQCKECKGSRICNHNKYKSSCKDCDGSQICEHNIHKQCCKLCNPSVLCLNCKDWTDSRIEKKKYDGYCITCFKHIFPTDKRSSQLRVKSQEVKVQNFLNENMKGFIHDKPIYTSHCDCTHRRRIDHRLLINNTLIAVETDERQHRGYNLQDEQDRYDDLYMVFGGKWIFIRFNPDSYIENGKRKNPDIKKRFPILLEEIKKQIQRIKEEKNTELVEIVKLYFDT
jgi:hypothetical protein